MAGTAFRVPYRVTAVVLGVACVSLLSNLDKWSASKGPRGDVRDAYGVGRTIERMAAVEGLLPAAARVVYFSDIPLNGDAGTLAYLVAQYALAPRVLLRPGQARGAAWGVGNYSRPVDFRSYGEAAGFNMLRDCGRGVVVYRKEDR